MTTASKITIVRLLLIPLFVVLGLRYGESVQRHAPDETLRWAAILVFLVAASSDWLDGYVARHFNQSSKAGAILDAIADKGLLVAGLLTLTFSNWGFQLPWELTALVIARDTVVVIGSFVLYYLNWDVQVRPRWTGKIATCFQITVVAWVMLQVRFLTPLAPVWLAAIFTAWSWAGYMTDGIRQLGHPRRIRSAHPVPATLSPIERPEP